MTGITHWGRIAISSERRTRVLHGHRTDSDMIMDCRTNHHLSESTYSLTKITISATDHTTRSAMLQREGRANSSPPTPQRRPMKRRAGIASRLAVCLLNSHSALLLCLLRLTAVACTSRHERIAKYSNIQRTNNASHGRTPLRAGWRDGALGFGSCIQGRRA